MCYHLQLHIHFNNLELYEGLMLFYATTGTEHFFPLSLLRVRHIPIWNLIKEKDTNDKQFFIRGNVKTQCWPLLLLDNATEDTKL